MARVLKQTVLADGVIYSAGTPATDDLEAKVPATFWDGDDAKSVQSQQRISKGYGDHTVAELEGEIDARNADRPKEDQIKPEGNKKADLVAALEADDAHSAGA